MQEDYSQKKEIEKMDIELKWEKYKKEQLNLIRKGNTLGLSVIGSAFIAGIFLNILYFFIGIEFILSTWIIFLSLCIFIGFCFFEVVCQSNNEDMKRAFFNENKKEIITLKTSKILDLTTLKEENSKNIFLVIDSNVRGRRKQIFTFATESKNGIKIMEYENENQHDSYFYYKETTEYKEINESEGNKPRLEMKVSRFSSAKLQREFEKFGNYKDFFTEYTFFIPKGSVEKTFYKGAKT